MIPVVMEIDVPKRYVKISGGQPTADEHTLRVWVMTARGYRGRRLREEVHAGGSFLECPTCDPIVDQLLDQAD